MIPRLLILSAALSVAALHAQQPATWLDRPLINWNQPAPQLPHAPAATEPYTALAKRCQFPDRRETAAERALSEAGWMPYLLFDRQIAERDVEIIGGLAAADGMCRPMSFNVFVFVAGRFAGTLSPATMTSRLDGSIGAVRLAPDDTVTAEFARYAASDALCCPSGHQTVRYRIDRSAPQPLVVPTAVAPTRQ
jgi:hypothetical protein